MDASTSKEFIRVYGLIQKLRDDVTVFAKEYYDASVVSYDEIANVPENLSDFNNDLGFVTEEEVDDKIQNSSIDDSNFLKKSGEEELQECSIPTEFGELYAETPDDEDSSTRVATTEFVHNVTNTDSIAQSVVGIINGNYTTSQEVEQAIDQKIGQHSYNNVVSLVAGEIQSAVGEINNTIENIDIDSHIPTNVSSFTNDAGYITLSDIPADSVTSVNGLTGDVQLTIPTVPTNVSAFTNDAGYITDAGVTSVNNCTGAVSVLENVQADWTATSGLASILHKPALKRVATTGDYNDLDNTPTIPVVPTNVSDFTNDAGYLTSFTESDPTVPAHVKAITQLNITDWNNKLSSFTETDPTVPAWAKASTKPTYTASEVGAATLQLVLQEVAALVDLAPTTLDTLNELAAALGNDPNFATTVSALIGAKYTKPSTGIPYTDLDSATLAKLDLANTALQSFTETDPTVPSWAKLSTKPTYTASEVGALPDTTAIPSKTSDLTNDSGFITGYTETDPTVPSYVKNISLSDISNWNNKLSSFTESDPTVPSHVKGITTTDISNWNGKQAAIADLSDIRSGAALGATALQSYTETDPTVQGWAKSNILINGLTVSGFQSSYQLDFDNKFSITSGGGLNTISYTESDPTVPAWAKQSTKPSYNYSEINNTPDLSVYATTSYVDNAVGNLADVATSGNYDDLENKPTIPSAVTESTVSGWGFTKNTGTYSKPSGGIPKTDLASAVLTSLGLADSALQSYTETDPTVPSHVKAITTTDIASWNAKLDSAPVTSVGGLTGAVSLKTVNNESLVGSGNITIQGGGSGVSSSTDNAIARFDGTTGALLNSGVLVDDDDNVILPVATSATFANNAKLVLGNAWFGSNPSGALSYGTRSGSTYTGAFVFESTGLRPIASANGTVDLGTSSSRWRDLYVSGTITDGTYTLTRPNKSGTIAVTSDIPSAITIYTGTSTPSSSLGSNGDIYIKTS